MDTILEFYADLILRSALKIEAGDQLTIFTEEDNSYFAHIISREAKAISGNGVYIQLLENGKIIATEEAETDFKLEKSPTLLLHLTSNRPCLKTDVSGVLSAKELQEFHLLSEPLEDRKASVSYAVAPIPNDDWGSMLLEDGDTETTLALLNELFSLEDNYIDIAKEREEINVYTRNKLNRLKLKSGVLRDENGTDLSFEFLEESEFACLTDSTAKGRTFIPSLYSSSVFRAIKSESVNGFITLTRPINLFGVIVNHMTLSFKDGVIENITAEDEVIELFRMYLQQDRNAGKLSSISLTDETSAASQIEYFDYNPWDNERTISVTLGGPRPEGILDLSRATDSLVSLNIPVGSFSTSLECRKENGEEILILEDGIIREEDD